MKKRVLNSLICVTLCSCVAECFNTTETYARMKNSEFRNKQQRLLSFNTDEDGDVTVELAFNVPFLRIPVKKSLDLATGAVANVNLGSVILAGAMMVVTVFLIPATAAFLFKKMPNLLMPRHNNYRNEDADFATFWQTIAKLDASFGDVYPSSCINRMVCWAVKTSSKNVANGWGTSGDKIIDGLATNKWLLHAIDSTAVNSAIESGLQGKNCSKEYHKCQLSKENMEASIQDFIESIK